MLIGFRVLRLSPMARYVSTSKVFDEGFFQIKTCFQVSGQFFRQSSLKSCSSQVSNLHFYNPSPQFYITLSALWVLLGPAWYESATASCWFPTVQTPGHESVDMRLSSIKELSSPVALTSESVLFKSETCDGSGPRGLPWPQDVQQELQQRFWQGLWFPCNCLLMTCTAVRSGGNVLNNVTWQARLSLSEKDPNIFLLSILFFIVSLSECDSICPFKAFLHVIDHILCLFYDFP